jgi:hypothetical protein
LSGRAYIAYVLLAGQALLAATAILFFSESTSIHTRTDLTNVTTRSVVSAKTVAPHLRPERPRPEAGPRSAASYRDCGEARRATAIPIPQGAPGYRRDLDPDGDGRACEPREGRSRRTGRGAR